MADATGDIKLHIHGNQGLQNTTTSKNEAPKSFSSYLKLWKWWLIMLLNIFLLLSGQSVGVLMGRFYYSEGGNSKWMNTLVMTAGFPVLFVPLLVHRYAASKPPSVASVPNVSFTKIITIYILLGLIMAADNLMFSYGLLYLPVSTYSLICATQLAFNAVFTYFINAQKFTSLIFNSVVLLTFAASLLAVQSGSDDSKNISKDKYPLGYVLTVGASAICALILTLYQFTFKKVIKRETYSVVLHMQIWPSAVAACVSVAGLFASGEWRTLSAEMHSYDKGKAVYVMTLVSIAVAWQVNSIATLGLIFVASSLFAGVICTLAQPVVPIFAVIFFHDKMSGVKVIAMLIGIWGFLSYIYQQYLDDKAAKKAAKSLAKNINATSSL